MGSRSPALHYVPYGELAGVPSVVVDGSPTDGTVLCLSHWPGIGSPPAFAADLSAEMAFSYLDAGSATTPAPAPCRTTTSIRTAWSGVFALASPAEALPRRDLLVEVARAGDFADTSSREAARVSMVLSAYADPERSPLGSPHSADYDELTASLYAELLGPAARALRPRGGRSESLWGEEDATLSAHREAALASGSVTISEVPELDLAVVEVDPGRTRRRWPSLRRPMGPGLAPHGGPRCDRARRAPHRCGARTTEFGLPLRELGPVPIAPGARPGRPGRRWPSG